MAGHDTPALGLLPGLVGYRLRMAQLALFDDFARALRGHDVSPGRFGVLVLIEANPGLAQGQLAEAMHLNRSTIVTTIDALERRGLVERRPVAGDRRANALWLTGAGQALLDVLKPRVAEHEATLLAGFSADDKHNLAELLERLRRAAVNSP